MVDISYLQDYADAIRFVINDVLVPVLMGVAFIVFLWGVYTHFILDADNEESQRSGRQLVLWSVIGFAIIISIWGLVNVVLSTFGLQVGGHAPPPPIL